MATKTVAELQNEIVAKEKALLLKIAGVIKSYTDDKISVTADEIKKEVVDNLSKIDGLGEQLEKIQKMADAFAKVFDENKDGEITADEIVAKLAAIQANIDKVGADLKTLADKEAKDVANILQNIAKVEGKVEGNTAAIQKVDDAVKKVEATLSTDYYTKEDIEALLMTSFDGIEAEIEKLFAPEAKDVSTTGTKGA